MGKASWFRTKSCQKYYQFRGYFYDTYYWEKIDLVYNIRAAVKKKQNATSICQIILRCIVVVD